MSSGSWKHFKLSHVLSEGKQLMCAGMHELVSVCVCGSLGAEQQRVTQNHASARHLSLQTHTILHKTTSDTQCEKKVTTNFLKCVWPQHPGAEGLQMLDAILYTCTYLNLTCCNFV